MIRTTHRNLTFNASKESREEQVVLQSKRLELNLTEAVRQQLGGRKQGEDLSVYAIHIMKAAEAARLSKDSITRLVHTSTGHAVSTEALEKAQKLTGTEDKFKQWKKDLLSM